MKAPNQKMHLTKTAARSWQVIYNVSFRNMNKSIQNENGMFLGLAAITALIILGTLPFYYGYKIGPIQPGPATIVIGIQLQFLGILFLLSYYFSHKTFFFRWLIWFCEHSRPNNRKMAFFYFFLLVGSGVFMLLKGIGLFSK